MKIKASCMECAQEYFVSVPLDMPMTCSDNYQNTLEITDDLIIEFTCKNGHENILAIANPKYEILFDMGIGALLDGYNREAVADIAASLERFYEYCINAFVCQDNDHGIFSIKEYWGLVNRSEMQYGAFITLYLYCMGKLPDEKGRNKKANFRNRVIHQGYFPSYDDTVDYIEYVAEYITRTKEELSTKVELWRATYPQIANTTNKCMANNAPISSMSLSTALSCYSEGDKVDRMMETFKKQFDLQYCTK